jgi:hypothetical protein
MAYVAEGLAEVVQVRAVHGVHVLDRGRAKL